MLRTSIQACGTATTTLAWPKPSGVSISTASSASAICSRTRSSPVMPRCAVPLASWLTISEADRKATSTSGHAGERAAIIAGAAGLGEDEAGAGEERGGVLLQAPLGGNGQDERGIGHQGLPTMRSSQKEQPTAGIGASAPEMLEQPVVAAAAHDRACRRCGAGPAPRR